MVSSLAILCIFAFVLFVSCNGLSCKDQNGKDVDWFVAYKLPQLLYASSPLVKEGTAFLYMDARTKAAGWKMTTVGIDKPDQAIGHTLQQVYSNLASADHFHMMYNDEWGCLSTALPDVKCNSDGYRAHSKGVTLFNQKDGFWLIHSIPGFPATDAYKLQEKSKMYGQSVFCATFDTNASLSDLSQQWYRHHPSVYSSSPLPAGFNVKYPALVEIVGNKPIKPDVSVSRVANLRTKAGLSLTHFAKHRKWNKDLYADLVAPTMATDLYVETWLRGNGDLRSGCPASETVWNVREVSPGDVKFLSGNDHSKWAVGESHKKPIVCIGDINRQVSQYERGGGTLCFEDENVWTAYRDSITLREKCAVDPVIGVNGTAEQEDGALEIAPYGGECKNFFGDSQCKSLLASLLTLNVRDFFCDNVGGRLCRMACKLC